MKVLVFIGISLTALFSAMKSYGILNIPWPMVLTPMWVAAVAYLIHVFSNHNGYDDDLGE